MFRRFHCLIHFFLNYWRKHYFDIRMFRRTTKKRCLLYVFVILPNHLSWPRTSWNSTSFAVIDSTWNSHKIMYRMCFSGECQAQRTLEVPNFVTDEQNETEKKANTKSRSLNGSFYAFTEVILNVIKIIFLIIQTSFQNSLVFIHFGFFFGWNYWKISHFEE